MQLICNRVPSAGSAVGIESDIFVVHLMQV